MEKVYSRKTDKQELYKVLHKETADLFEGSILEDTSETWTFYTGNDIVGIGGIVGVPSVSMGEAWLIPTDEFFKHPLSSLTVRATLREAENRLGYKRYQMTARIDNIKNQRFAEWMGYQKEGILRSYVNGVDYIMYARIAGEF